MTNSTSPLKTPQGREVTAPTEALRLALAAERDQKERPLTRLTYTTLDMVCDKRDRIIDVMLAYLHTDGICYFSENPLLKDRQKEHWQPVIDWIIRRYDCSILAAEGIMPVNQPPATEARIREVLASLDDWKLTGLMALAQCYNSLLLALAVSEGECDAEQAFNASQVDEQYQNEQWGTDETTTASRERIRSEIEQTLKFLELVG